MKKIEAIIRKTKFDEVKEALTEVGIDFFSFWEMRGVGQARQERVYRGVVYDTGTIERIMTSCFREISQPKYFIAPYIPNSKNSLFMLTMIVSCAS